jgi:phosphatidylserine decarboxylase
MRRKGKDFPIVLEGVPYILPPTVVTVILGLMGKLSLFSPFLLLTLFILAFFRNPPRKIPENEGLILSPADGRVVGVEEVATTHFVEGKATKISIFMSIFNVHVNRMPIGGTVQEVSYRKGRFLPANRGEASQKNEQNILVLEDAKGLKLVFVQVAGIVARRIVCYVRRGDHVQTGEVFGAILFGSRLDVYLPAGVEVVVHRGERVRAGQSVLGAIK